MYGDDAPAEENRLVVHSSAAAKERTLQELAKLDEQSKRYLQAEQLQEEIEHTKDRYLQVLDTVNERQKSIMKLETHVNKLFKEGESKISKI